MDTDEDMYQATPQIQGKLAHTSVDAIKKKNNNSISSLSVISDEFSIMGKIDIYYQDKKFLVERKYQMKQIFKGQIYQLWAQYFCMKEMGFIIEKLAFYEISTNKMIPIDIPSKEDKEEFRLFIKKVKNYNPNCNILFNSNKCIHCIYCNLCDKTNFENVYT